MIKLSFSINGWKDYSWQDFTELASEIGFKGIELHNAMESNLTQKDGPFHKYNSAATIRKLADDGISVPCVDISKDISMENTAENAENKTIIAGNDVFEFLEIKENNPPIRKRLRI